MIREFTATDLEAVMKLWLEGNLQAHDFVPADYWIEHLAAVRAQLQQAEVYVCEENRQVVAFVGMQDDYLAGIFVDKEFRSHGLGKQLLDHVKEIHDSFSLHVYQQNKGAVQFYLREGLRLVSEAVDEETGQVDYLLQWH